MKNNIWIKISQIGIITNLIIITIFIYLLENSKELVPVVFLISIVLIFLILVSDRPRKNESDYSLINYLSVIFGLLFPLVGILSFLINKNPLSGLFGGSIGIIILSFSFKSSRIYKIKKSYEKIFKGALILLTILFNIYTVVVIAPKNELNFLDFVVKYKELIILPQLITIILIIYVLMKERKNDVSPRL